MTHLRTGAGTRKGDTKGDTKGDIQGSFRKEPCMSPFLLGMTYVRQSQEQYEAEMKEKQIKALKRQARQLGLEVIAKTSGGAATAVAAAEQE